jgi:tRNA(adenine34) deaminase
MTNYMKKALLQAEKALEEDEVPIGAVIVKDGQIISRAHNAKEKTGLATRHAEIIAIEKACKKTGDWRLNGCEMYVTLEPCPMCAGAIINARIDKLFFGAYDEKAGCCGTLYNLLQDGRFNHRVQVVGGVMREECARILNDFFKSKRGKI